ncbi:tetratricopeptide repeat protein [Chryseolinea soli]|uniref:Tetratricopeptide repeat protein n=1 Tax=Chryseolinea soli TaxID=2321403 RepID=A0A385SWI5_9BACT|nr:tetratricopeptide repeat protein [Chryseolinea soli]AYB35202.1 tetratricopeptide repeat protein [Chryseolinea soli]
MKPNVCGSFYLAFFLSLSAFGQKIDSLQAVLDTAKNDHKVKTLNELFRANLRTDPVKALGYTREALNLATEIGDKKGMAASYNNLGIIYRNQGALDKALDYYITSMKIYETLGNKEGIASTKNNISTIYSIKKEYGQAMKYLEDSYALFVELKDDRKIIGSMNNLGNLNLEIQLYEKAMKYFSEASQLSDKLGIKFADPLNNMGNIYFRQGNYQHAVEFYEKALAIERANDNKLGILNVLTNLGITYAKAKQPKPAAQYLDEATKLCQDVQAFSFLPPLYKAQAENASTQNNWKVAYDMMLKYDDAREKIFGEESTRNIAQMEMVIDFQEKEKEYDMMQQQGEITKLELRNTRMFILLIILAVLGIIGALNFFYINKKVRHKKNSPVA